MRSSRGIIWLSSYPKSGNTWFRIVLSHLLNQSTSLDYINDMDSILGSPMVANRSWMNQSLGIESNLLNQEELNQLRPIAYTKHAKDVQRTTYIKIHDAYTYNSDNKPLIPDEGCLGAVYFIRNPLDVAVSLSHHAKCPIDWSIHMMANEGFSVPLDVNNEKQINQKLLSWSSHVKSWAAASSIKVLFLRYEDMFFNPFDTFKQGMDFLNIQVSPEMLQQAIEDASFDKLQAFEERFDFKEKAQPDGRFFRKGVVDDWKTTLTEEQVKRIIRDHGEIMHAYGYLDDSGKPVMNIMKGYSNEQ